MKVLDSIKAWGISPQLAENLTSPDSSDSDNNASHSNTAIENFFPVQIDVIPILLKQNKLRSIKPRDLCVSAPTGSGKTLSYAVPILNTLEVDVSRKRR